MASNKFGIMAIMYNFEEENTFDRLNTKIEPMKLNAIVDFLIRNGFLPNKKQAVLAPVPVKSKPSLSPRKSK